MHWVALHSSSQSALYYTVSVLGQEEWYTVKYTPSPEGVPKGKGVFLTVYPESNPIMDDISLK